MQVRGTTQGLVFVVCGLLAGPCLECAADDWLRTRTRTERNHSAPTPMLRDPYAVWGNEQDVFVIGSFFTASSLDEHSTLRRRSSRSTVIRAQNSALRGLPDMFDGEAPLPRRFDDPSAEGRGLATRSDAGAEHDADTPGPIEDPGPDSADFPDSAFTVKPGVVYFETSLTTESSKGPRVRDYFTNTLIRVGLVENWELRISSPGLIQEVGPGIDTTGFGSFTFGFKHHVWDEDKDGWLPAMGIIAQVKAPTASAGFDNSSAEPTIFFNFDKGLPMEFDFEINSGVTWAKDDNGDRFVQGNILWALGHEIAPHVEAFTHGFANFPFADGRGAEVVVGPGVAWIVSPRTMLDFSLNFGLTDVSPHRITRFGLSLAF